MKKLKKKLYPLLQRSRRMLQITVYNVFVHIFKCNEKRILIASNTKNELYGNLQYIYQELQKYDYDIQLLMINKANFWKRRLYNLKLLYYVATSKYILIDDFFPIMYVLKIRKGSKFIQVWHALGAFKRVGYSRKDIGNENSITHKNYTDTIMSSESIVENYAEAFGISKEKVHPIGIPRTDLFFNQEEMEKIKARLYEKYSNLKNKRVILFAPTFRGSGRKSAHYPKEYINLEKIYQNLQENDVFIIKMHPFIKNKIVIKEEYQDKMMNLTDYGDINDLLLITDVLITDYSSVIFEYSFMERPIIFYVPDLEEYNNSRSFYYDYSEYIYGSVAKTQEELLNAIENPKLDIEKQKKFKEKFLNQCDGKSTQRFVEQLILK